MFVQRLKTRYDQGETKGDKQNPRRNLDHVTCNYCVENDTMRWTMDYLHRKKSKRKQNHSEYKNLVKYGNKPPNGGEQETLVKF